MDGMQLRQAREKLGIPSRQLARVMRASHSYLARVEGGQEPLTQEYYRRYLAALRRIHRERSEALDRLGGTVCYSAKEIRV